MRLMLWIIAGLTALYCGYWALASRAIRDEAGAMLAAMRAEGTADVATVDVGGFPARFDVTLGAPQFASRDGTFRWSAPELRLSAPSYRPQHVIALLPTEQRLLIGRETVAVGSETFSASAVFGLSARAPLDHAQTVGKAVVLSSDAGWRLAADEVRAAIRRGEGEAEQRIGIELLGLALSGLPAEAAPCRRGASGSPSTPRAASTVRSTGSRWPGACASGRPRSRRWRSTGGRRGFPQRAPSPCRTRACPRGGWI